MGHAGAIISGGTGTATEKMAAMKRAGITVVKSPAGMGEAVARVLAAARPSRVKSAAPAKPAARKRAPRSKPAEKKKAAT
jgi:hypothetical protein